jgi:hypothetical protein
MDWLPAISTTLALSFLLWLGRKLIATRLINAVKHEYDEKIENLKATLRQNEESFKAELKAKEPQIEALRSGALSGIVNRQAVLYERQLSAIEQLWGAVISLAPAKAISAFMASVKFEAAAKEAAQNNRFRELFAMLGGGFDIKSLQSRGASKTRPFISPLAWALYSAYQAIVIDAALKLHMLKSGIDAVDILNTGGVTKLVKVALPHRTEYVEKYGPSACYYLLDELESSLLIEFGNILQGVQSDNESIERAALILKAAERLMEENASLNKSE